MFVTDAAVLADLMATIKIVDPAKLPPWWNVLVSLAHPQAYQDLVRGLAQRGYSAAQIAAWDDGPTYERQQSLYYLLSEARVTEAAGENAPPQSYVGRLDKRKAMCSVQVTNGGVFQYPAAPVGQVMTGNASAGGNDLVDWQPGQAPHVPGESRRGPNWWGRE